MKKYLLLLPIIVLLISCSPLTNDNIRDSWKNISGHWTGNGERLRISLPYDDKGNCWFVYESSSRLVLEGSVNIKNTPYKSNQWGDKTKHLNLIIKNTSNPRVSRERFSNWIYIYLDPYGYKDGELRSNGMEISQGFYKLNPEKNSDYKPDNFKMKFWKLLNN